MCQMPTCGICHQAVTNGHQADLALYLLKGGCVELDMEDKLDFKTGGCLYPSGGGLYPSGCLT